jgi:hypothetical protein
MRGRRGFKNRIRAVLRDAAAEAFQPRVDELNRELRELRDELRAAQAAGATSGARLQRIQQIVAAEFDDIPRLAQELHQVRQSSAYEEAFTVEEPLVSVRIATYNNPGMLIDRALASVFAQTYERIEVVVVGDACTDDTEQRVASLGDPRVRFVNLTARGAYPDEPRDRWLVAGSPAMNLGMRLSQGLWIAPLDHDDEFVPDHVETLLKTARRNDLELAYGKLLAATPPGYEDWDVGEFPPRLGEFGFQAAIHVTALRVFEYNPLSWLLDEPGDWNLCRRMLEAGVRMGWIDRVVSRYYPGPFVLQHRSTTSEP